MIVDPNTAANPPERTGWGRAVWGDVCVRFATGSKKGLPLRRYCYAVILQSGLELYSKYLDCLY